MTRQRLRKLSLIVLLLFGGPATAADLATGTVVDAQGHPVAGARVGTSFTFAPTVGDIKVQISYADPPVVSDAAGSFSLPAAPIRYTHVLVAAANDGTLGFARREDSGATRIVLRKPARLKVTILKQFGHPHAFSIDLMSAGSAVGYGSVSGGATEWIVPQGALELTGVGDPESIAISEKLLLMPDHPTLVRLELQPTSWARNLGKAAPTFTPTDVHNWRTATPFASPRGKWVFVSFWATWCGPCVKEMPRLIDFYQEHAPQRGRFEIIAVHSADGTSFAGIQAAYDHLVQIWGKQVPFPLVFDSTGETQKRWGIQVYPTSLLIDPEGRLVGAATIEDLAAKLKTAAPDNS